MGWNSTGGWGGLSPINGSPHTPGDRHDHAGNKTRQTYTVYDQYGVVIATNASWEDVNTPNGAYFGKRATANG